MHGAQYRRVADEMRRRIEVGEWGAGDRVPSKRTLADQYGVQPGVITRAIDLLQDEGLLLGTQRTGVWVADPVTMRVLTDVDAPGPYRQDTARSGWAEAGGELAGRLGVALGVRVEWEQTEYLDARERPSHLRTVQWVAGGPAAARVGGPPPVIGSRWMTEGESDHLGLRRSFALVVQFVRVDAAGGPVEAVDLVLPADRWKVQLG